ncbi:ABC transporter substrate-binding protein [Glycomyces buryatensis]|uniref:ABC transporter substrate-binding protein n=1 Tax=Glycomyces buryatensis TaxID=2570927 RepID=A0A4S8QFA5_9ACTN|nr:ABC transporter substrate-binding protein [Glycomyces buryatensis]THV41812.1 ABC transporter substrate-binding protein [Glycomyces buryatensis]
MKRRVFSAVLALAGTSALTACSSSDPFDSGSDGGDGATIVIGSQDYYSNEIVAEIYAQALEAEGYTVDRQFRIGQREAYLPEIEEGQIDLFPEYTGPLLQYWNPDAAVNLSDEVYAELEQTVPDGLRVLDQSAANDQDSYTVTQEFADEWSLTEIGDLADVTDPLVLGANSEAETRPFGPDGMKEAYGIDIGFTPIEDGGGPLTVQALEDGDIQLAVVYTASPSIAQGGLVTLEDPEGLFLASNVVPLASDNVDDDAAAVVNGISASMDTADLIALNVRSVEEELPAATIAEDWLAENSK